MGIVKWVFSKKNAIDFFANLKIIRNSFQNHPSPFSFYFVKTSMTIVHLKYYLCPLSVHCGQKSPQSSPRCHSHNRMWSFFETETHLITISLNVISKYGDKKWKKRET